MPSLVSCLLLLAASADALVLSGARPVLAAPRVAQPPTMQLFGLGKPPKSAEELLEEKVCCASQCDRCVPQLMNGRGALEC